MTGIRLVFTYFLAFISITVVVAQPSFNMSNATTNECEGILMDSDNGMLPDTYDNNENYTFKICVPGGEKIIFTFAKFCTEEKLDYLRFFDGPDTLSPMIGGPFSGTVLPPAITATSGCLTINFISDANIQCLGWLGSWKVEIDDPLPPQMMV
ncbi:MAG TPA: CUB domain-containing protein, partial [Saprospiraceae bacterium]|nr:CUB domain-containing protein [Saprospiraceae bacterium]